MMKPAANAPNANMKPALALPAVKFLAISAASVPNRKKSYHSNTVPMEEATTTWASWRDVDIANLGIRASTCDPLGMER
jgi:hypothetical protein